MAVQETTASFERKLAEIPYEELREEHLQTLMGLSGRSLKAVVKYAEKQEPPNTEIIAAAGMIALGNLNSPINLDRRADAKVAERAFPSLHLVAMQPARIPLADHFEDD
jgi:hypothetical protein